ncbi:MAG TPA: phosphohistidine phosphatase SixA [Elusimicrobia bacterium]|nr:phosphohistidine phosphatase SixA [Elusimicrobiota bacterium]
MKLYLMRHGHSPSVLEAGVGSDRERPLSERGRAEVRRSAAHLAKAGAKPGIILCSPLLRAKQTAEEAAAQLGGPPVRPYDPLANVLPGSALVREVAAFDWGCDEVLLVGHMPQVAEAASHLSEDRAFSFSTAEVASFEVSKDGSGRLLWKTAPDEVVD